MTNKRTRPSPISNTPAAPMDGGASADACVRILVVGDVSINWLLVDALSTSNTPVSDNDQALPRRRSPGFRLFAMLGGAWTVASLVEQAIESLAPELRKVVSVTCYDQPADCKSLSFEQAVHSLSRIAQFPGPERTASQRAYRIAEMHGFSGPIRGPIRMPVNVTWRFETPPDLIVIHDSGNGFSELAEAPYWLEYLDLPKTIVVLKAGRHLPKAGNLLWDKVLSRSGPTVVIISSDALRVNGVAISKGLSWERTATDVVHALRTNGIMRRLCCVHELIVRLDLSGVIHCHRNSEDSHHCQLYYDPHYIEATYQDEKAYGQIVGINSVLTAAVVKQLCIAALGRVDAITLPKVRRDAIARAAIDGILVGRQLLDDGFGSNAEDLARLDGRPLKLQHGFSLSKESRERLHDVTIPPDPSVGTDGAWSILHSPANANSALLVDRVAVSILMGGIRAALAEPTFPRFPVAEFGKLVVVDRAEIEAFRNMEKLIREYAHHPRKHRPLCVAVFGPPGSGKSFGLKQVAAGSQAARIRDITCNVSQLASPDELATPFLLARDAALDDMLPLITFDEFDTPLGGAHLGWLKCFLAPMQDGVFRYGAADLKLGKAIIAFCGSLYRRFASFVGDDSSLSKEDRALFQRAKGPDFASRLRGYVNVVGPNPTSLDTDSGIGFGDRSHLVRVCTAVVQNVAIDHVFAIRRAILIRSLLESQFVHLLDSTGHARLDQAVVAALLRVSRFKHGVRSIEAIFEMSNTMRGRLDKASLPASDQMEAHVPADEFGALIRAYDESLDV